VPLLTELAQNEKQRKMFEFASQPVAMQQPFVAPPGIPADRLQLLRRGFDAMTKDPEFRSEASRLDLEEVQKIVKAIVSTPKDVIQDVQAATVVSETGSTAPAGKAGAQ
jgi:hypothetical protein